MHYYNQLMAQARAYRGLALFYRHADHPRWKFFAEQGKACVLKAIEVRKNT